METITVIIPTHNYGRYIAETLESLLNQTYPHWECIVVDDGSVDNTWEIVNRYVDHDARFRYIHQECQGVSVARNVGLDRATGSYIQFLDADDLLSPQKLELHAHFLRQNPSIDIVYSDVRYFVNDDLSQLSFSFDMTNTEWLPKVDHTPNAAISHLMKSNIMPIHAPLSRTKFLAAVGPFNSAMRYCEDWDYWFRCAVAGAQIRYLDEHTAMVFVRVHQTSAGQNSTAMLGGGKLMTEQFIRYLKQYPDVVSAPRQIAIKRARSLDLIVDNHLTEGLLLGLSTVAQRTAGDISIRDVLYWFKKTLLAPRSAE